MEPLPDGYTWSGDLDEVDIRGLYAACSSLRFSGRLELRDGAQQAEVAFIAGEPVDITGGDTDRIALWNRGTFRAVQSIPNLSGELTRGQQFEGSLAITKPSTLWSWIGEYRLSCEIDIERPGQRAQVTFSHGHAESAQVNGTPEMAALARVSSWSDGSFRVRLRPLFVDGVALQTLPELDGDLPAPRQFDVSRAIPMDLRAKAESSTPAILAPPISERPRSVEVAPVTMKAAEKSDAALWIVSGLLVVCAGAVGAAYLWWPVAPVPKPAVEVPAKPASPEELARTTPPAESPVAVTNPAAATAVTDKPREPRTAVDRMVLKARALLIEGHSRAAVDLLRKAEKLRPKDPNLHIYELQAAGKLGHAELVLEGKGTLVLDGHKFSAPKRLKVAAGPHTVEGEGGESELVLKRGEKKHLKARR